MPVLPILTDTSNPYNKINDGKSSIARLQFPSDMGRYYIAFEFAEYSYAYNSGAVDLAGGTVTTDINNIINLIVNPILGTNIPPIKSKAPGAKFGIGPINASIALPVPTNLVDDQQLDYNSENLLNVAATAVGAVAGATLGRFSGAAGEAEKFQSMYSGQKVNPFLAMMFNGPRFKTHQFAWRFSPKTPDETEMVRKICNTFKAKSLPEQYAGGAMFSYPNVCMISLYPDNAREMMYKFKPAVIQQTQIHYAPSGVPSFFAGTNAPAEIELKIQLSEISVWTHNDLARYDYAPTSKS